MHLALLKTASLVNNVAVEVEGANASTRPAAVVAARGQLVAKDAITMHFGDLHRVEFDSVVLLIQEGNGVVELDFGWFHIVFVHKNILPDCS